MNETRPIFAAQEDRMLNVLTDGERQILSELMSKLVIAAQDWAGDLPDLTPSHDPDAAKGTPQ